MIFLQFNAIRLVLSQQIHVVWVSEKVVPVINADRIGHVARVLVVQLVEFVLVDLLVQLHQTMGGVAVLF
jgi:hypothetical protein